MRKWTVFMLVALMALSATAYAVPSKTTSDMAQVLEVVTSTGVAVDPGFIVKIVEDTEPVAAELARIFEHVVKQGNAPVTFFNEEVQLAVAEKLPEEFDLSTLEMNEFVPLAAYNYDEAYGDVEVFFTFVTEYAEGQKVVAMLGLFTGEVDEDGNDIVEWLALEAEVQADGRMKILFPSDVVVRLEAAPYAALAILSEPAAEPAA